MNFTIVPIKCTLATILPAAQRYSEALSSGWLAVTDLMSMMPSALSRRARFWSAMIADRNATLQAYESALPNALVDLFELSLLATVLSTAG